MGKTSQTSGDNNGERESGYLIGIESYRVTRSP